MVNPPERDELELDPEEQHKLATTVLVEGECIVSTSIHTEWVRSNVWLTEEEIR